MLRFRNPDPTLYKASAFSLTMAFFLAAAAAYHHAGTNPPRVFSFSRCCCCCSAVVAFPASALSFHPAGEHYRESEASPILTSHSQRITHVAVPRKGRREGRNSICLHFIPITNMLSSSSSSTRQSPPPRPPARPTALHQSLLSTFVAAAAALRPHGNGFRPAAAAAAAACHTSHSPRQRQLDNISHNEFWERVTKHRSSLFKM